MEENKKDVLPLEGEPLTTPQISEPVVNALAAALNKIETYVPTQYINDGPPDIDAEHLNHAEQAIMRVTNLANGAADAISALQSQVTQLNSDFSVYKYSSSKVEMSGQLDSIIEWLKSNTTKFFVYNYVRVEPTDSDGYFGNSSFDILWNLSSASYGWIMLRSDNPKSVLFGRLVDGNAQWDIPVFKSDIPKLYYTIESSIINNPAEVIKQKWDSMPDGYYLCEMRCGSAYIAIVQRIDDGQHGSVIVHGYGGGLPIYLKRVNSVWL
jgi:hypothetical protein